jgi:hypothetical protein
VGPLAQPRSQPKTPAQIHAPAHTPTRGTHSSVPDLPLCFFSRTAPNRSRVGDEEIRGSLDLTTPLTPRFLLGRCSSNPYLFGIYKAVLLRPLSTFIQSTCTAQPCHCASERERERDCAAAVRGLQLVDVDPSGASRGDGWVHQEVCHCLAWWD